MATAIPIPNPVPASSQVLEAASNRRKRRGASSRTPYGSTACVACGRFELRRSNRRGFMEIAVYSLLGYFPWRCKHCGERQLLRDRGAERPAS